MCIFCSEAFDLLRDELALVLGEYVHLPLEDDFVDIEITFIGFGSKNWLINMCILCFETFDILHDELALVLVEYVHLPLVDDMAILKLLLLDSAPKIDI